MSQLVYMELNTVLYRGLALKQLFGIRMLTLPGPRLYTGRCFYLVRSLSAPAAACSSFLTSLSICCCCRRIIGAGVTSSLTC